MCLGYRSGTDCRHRSRSTQKTNNWEKWQLCYNCARKLHPEFYKNTKNHGVKKFPGSKRYSKTPFNITKLPEIEQNIKQKIKIPIKS